MKDKIITKKNMYILLLFVIFLSFLVIKSTYAKFTEGFTTSDDIVNYSYNLDFEIASFSLARFADYESSSTLEEYEIVEVKADSYSIFNIDVTNSVESTIYYGIWYKMISTLGNDDDVTISKLATSSNNTSGSLTYNETKTVTAIAINNTDSNISFKIGVSSSDISADDIGYYDGRKLISGVADRPNYSEVNTPNLTGGMIPVIYDDKSNSWVKADSTNKGNSWYDYSNKKWANVVLVSDSTRSSYLNASIGSSININDVLAFYVWIPRFKYRVWNINRQATDTDSYTYNAYSKGIEISFESDADSTGNVTCSYDVKILESQDNLSDNCKYVDTDVTTTSDNLDYVDAWYTHPAFTYGDKNLTGFWIGKFETTGTSTNPTILPDNVSLRGQSLSEQFTTANKFKNYGLTNDFDARILRNIEWGAVSYLTYSVYGLCDGSSCRDVYINNSTSYYTGRSYGNVSASGIGSTYGTYSYDGYLMNSNTKTTTKDITKVASTTGNITGVYDLSGGSSESVMGNIVNTSFGFNVGSAGDNWNGASTLDSKYYNSYSNGSKNNNQLAYNRAMLGDATAEVTSGTGNGSSSWKPGVGTVGVGSYFAYNSKPWFIRGGGVSATAGMFSYGYSDGASNDNYTFRSVLS